MGKKRNKTGEKANIFETVRTQGVEIYLFLMLCVYPLFMGKGYGELIYRKWALFLYATMAFVAVSAVTGCAAAAVGRRTLHGQGKGGRFWERWILTDWFVLGYMVCALISYVGAVEHEAGFWGVETWYLGLASQLLFGGIYFGVSRGYAELKYLEYLAAAVLMAVNGIIVLQRFGVDVANLYAGYGSEVKQLFVTTQGQVTWTSSYTSIVLVAGMGMYYLSQEKREKLFLGICIGFGFGAGMLINCDSGMLAVAAALMVMAWQAIGHKDRLLALAEIVMAALAAVAIVGILERCLEERMVPIDAVYLKVAQSWLVYALLAAVAVFYLFVKKGSVPWAEKGRMVRALKGIYVALVCLGIAGMAALFILHGKGYFAGGPTGTYFRFDKEWGKGRGFIWRVGAAVFADYNIWRKLFGCGPDNFMAYSYGLMGEEMRNFWPALTITNVHNEWFNGVLNYGIVGGAAYLGIFVTAAYRLLRSALEKEEAVMFGAGLAVVGYMAHNLLCYQQIIGTPLIFLLMGIGVAKVRKKETVKKEE